MLRNLRRTLLVNCLFLIVGATLVVARPAASQIVEIPDPNLRHAVRETLALSDEMPLTQQEMLRLTRLDAPEKQIKDLTGLEHATNLKWIDVHRNNISALKPLAQLTQLERLGLWVNPISDLSPLANLTKLRGLDLAGCDISDIAPVANLTQLEWLTLQWQQNHWITDISPLTHLTKLRDLRLSGNRIADIRPLTNLIRLEILWIDNNRIVDVSPLANLIQLTDLTLANNVITNFQPLFGLNLKSVDIDIHKLQELASVDVTIPDPNLDRAIREELGLPERAPLTQLVMNQLTRLAASDSQIGDLTGLEHAANLRWVNVHRNNISNLKPLAGLTQLEHLGLWVNPISDLSPLANLTQLRGLDLGGCDILDITPLANLTQLEWLTLPWNHLIEDITPLANLTQLTRLDLSGNRIVDINPLANLTALEKLWIENNQIVDISPLANLAALKELRIENNQIIDVSPLANLTQLTDLTIANNAITDFRPLFGLNLQSVDIDIHSLQELASGEVKISDPNLAHAIREEMGLPSGTPITQLLINQLTSLTAKDYQIADLTGLEYASNLKRLALPVNQIRDITPLAGLIKLEFLILRDNPIRDLTPLANLTNLTYINLAGVKLSDITALANLTKLKEALLSHMRLRDITPLAHLIQLVRLSLVSNQIVDVSPLANLTALKELNIERNNIIDLSPLQNLSLTTFTYDQVCSLPDPPIQYRIENRNLPSIIQSWGDNAVNLSHLSFEDRVSYHDIYWHHIPFGLHFLQTPPWSTLAGDIDRAIARREELLAKNPNMIFLVEIRIRNAHAPGQYPEDWFGWLRDENGNPVIGSRTFTDSYLIDFRIPEVQDIIVQQAISVSECGLFDGIQFDAWTEGQWLFLVDRSEDGSRRYYSTFEEEQEARLSILRRIRANVPDDFLIICNSNQSKLPYSVPYINGSFMETFYDQGGYTRRRIAEIEDTLLWFEENAREPQITCLRGQGIPTQPPDSPTNKRWMRFFTTMSLTLSDGYALYTTGHFYQEHFWHSFWDANLGQPIGPKAQQYQNQEGTFIREFTNGWAAYNRTGEIQTISLPAPATPVSDRGDNSASLTHLLPDLDGESTSRPKAAPTSTAMDKSTSWIWCRSPTASASPPQTPTATASSTFSTWSLSSSSSANSCIPY